jgi:TonB family protein
MTSDATSLLPIFTAVLWTLCLIVGILGLWIPYPHFSSVESTPLTPPTQLVNVQIERTPPASEERPIPKISSTPALPSPLPSAPPQVAIPQVPELTVAMPSPAISFALPTEGYAHIVDPSQAGFHRSSSSASSSASGNSSGNATARPPPPAAPAVTHLTFGQGEGDIPPPKYPREAQLGGEEGSILFRFSVDESGHVTTIKAVQPSRWPLLNRAATRAIQTHQFLPGPARTYEITIEFQLQQ